MIPDILDALARVPSPVSAVTPQAGHCRGCHAVWVRGDPEHAIEWHHPDCWWTAFVQAREALAAAGHVVALVRFLTTLTGAPRSIEELRESCRAMGIDPERLFATTRKAFKGELTAVNVQNPGQHVRDLIAQRNKAEGERDALAQRVAALEAGLWTLVDGWERLRDCSRTLGHLGMDDAVAEARALLAGPAREGP